MPSTALQVFGIRPVFGLPCASPYVTKLVYWLRLTGIEHTLHIQDASRLAEDSPTGKLPYVVLPGGERIADSEAIIERLGGPARGLDEHLSPAQRSHALALTRLVDEHLVWHAVVEPRWVDDAAWARYRCTLFGVDALPAEWLAPTDAVRAHVLAQWRGCGLGVLPAAQRRQRALADLQAVSVLVDGPQFMFGSQPCSADAAAAALIDHALHAPFDSPVAEQVRSKPYWAAYTARVHGQFRSHASRTGEESGFA